MRIASVLSLLAVVACAGCATTDPASSADERFLDKYTSPSFEPGHTRPPHTLDSQFDRMPGAMDWESGAMRDPLGDELLCMRQSTMDSPLRTERCYSRLDMLRMNRYERSRHLRQLER
jgi:hypothetical protein